MRRLTETVKKIKSSIEGAPDLPKDVFVVGIVILVGIAGFAMGRLSAVIDPNQQTLRVLFDTPKGVSSNHAIMTFSGAGEKISAEEPPPLSAGTEKMYVASKNGSTYYLPWCSGVARIKDENKIWFATKEDAEARGLRPAANCKGI